MPLFRKKPIVVEAVFWSGDNYDEVMVFCGGGSGNIVDLRGASDEVVVIHTRNGPSVQATKGEWIVKEPFPAETRKFYTCEAATFDKTFEQVPEKCTCCGRHKPEPSHPGFLCMTCIRNP